MTNQHIKVIFSKERGLQRVPQRILRVGLKTLDMVSCQKSLPLDVRGLAILGADELNSAIKRQGMKELA